MKKISTLCLVALTGLFALACGSEPGSAEAEGASGADLSKVGVPVLPRPNLGVCPPAGPGAAQCQALIVTTPDGTAARTSSTPYGWSPAQLASAYRIPAGSGGIVAIVDAYDNPNAEADLAVYRSYFGLPPCHSNGTTTTGCFTKVNQLGSTAVSTLPIADQGWAPEIALDVDMASAGCPSCKILLVEANTNNWSDLGAAVNMAAAMGATVISNSYAGAENAGYASYDTLYYNHPGIAITASTGDSGSQAGITPNYPAVSPHVIGVGGTSLTVDTSGRGWHENAWTQAGAGCSQFEPKPSWQTEPGCSGRAIADVSAVADQNTPVAVYDTYNGYPGWTAFGGTSVSSPLVAAIMAATGRGSNDASWFYAHPGVLYDVTSGCSGTVNSIFTCAGPGWDGPTGLGTLDGDAMAAPPNCGFLTAGQYLSPGQSLYSCDGGHVLVQQTDGNVVLYNTAKPGGWVPTWSAAGAWGHGHFTSIGTDGNFVVYNAAWQGIWQAGTWGHPGSLLSVQDDGNMVVYSPSWAPLWASNTWNL